MRYILKGWDKKTKEEVDSSKKIEYADISISVLHPPKDNITWMPTVEITLPQGKNEMVIPLDDLKKLVMVETYGV